MESTREDVRAEVVALINAGRELSPAEDEALADAFVDHLEIIPSRQRRRSGPAPLVYISVSALVILLAIPVVMVIQAYSALDGYLPQPDASALPLVYWVTLIVAVLALLISLVSDRTGWRLQIKPIRELPR